MGKYKDWLLILGMIVGPTLAVLGFIKTQNNLDGKVADLAQEFLAMKAEQDSMKNAAAIREAVRAWAAEHGGHRQPTQTEVVGELAKTATPVDTVAEKPVQQRQSRIMRYATRK